MDTRGARHLSARLAIGAAVGERVEVVTVEAGSSPVRPGDTGTLVSIDEDGVGVHFDSGAVLAVDPFAVRMRRVA